MNNFREYAKQLKEKYDVDLKLVGNKIFVNGEELKVLSNLKETTKNLQKLLIKYAKKNVEELKNSNLDMFF